MSRITSGFCLIGSGGGMRTSFSHLFAQECLRLFRRAGEALRRLISSTHSVGELDAEIGLDQQRLPIDLLASPPRKRSTSWFQKLMAEALLLGVRLLRHQNDAQREVQLHFAVEQDLDVMRAGLA